MSRIKIISSRMSFDMQNTEEVVATTKQFVVDSVVSEFSDDQAPALGALEYKLYEKGTRGDLQIAFSLRASLRGVPASTCPQYILV